MTDKGRVGRPKKIYPEFVCERLSRLEKIFKYTIRPEDWRFMHRTMEKPRDADEEAKRRKEYSALLKGLNHSELQGHCDPEVNTSLSTTNYPDLILLWQYAEGILLPHYGKAPEGLGGGVPQEALTLQRSEFARRLARYIVAAELQTTVEYLTKLCRNWDPQGEPTIGAV